MDRDTSKNQLQQRMESGGLSLPTLPDGLESALLQGHTLAMDGTNVVRVPFGVRQPLRQRPERPERWATVVLPFQSHGGQPTPPPHAA
ncbi:MAG: hypothetical protein AB8A41_04810 [Prochlorococcus sp.]|jgi:hypothetical protein|nr:hypothetical protein [Prochlorococcaceae cyanobacterium ETNP2_MAG_10]MDP6196748.1 hypothetical protein [Prochlorococcaceae cyanobacterium ETNP18_MAG_17]|tara:strand:- start:234 stop:497 length:264 start_codon:yes stop_codon:yes gene_type:complete